jgi:2,4-diketo-3-deoxy-L-fuconate hydrolase
MQDSKGKYPSNVVFTANELVAHVASIMTLEPGDVITCGSLAGVGAGREPPVFLKSGDEVVATVENIGPLTHRME